MDNQRYVYVVSVVSPDEAEPIVTVFDNRDAAELYREYEEEHQAKALVVLDTAPLYQNFYVSEWL